MNNRRIMGPNHNRRLWVQSSIIYTRGERLYVSYIIFGLEGAFLERGIIIYIHYSSFLHQNECITTSLLKNSTLYQ